MEVMDGQSRGENAMAEDAVAEWVDTWLGQMFSSHRPAWEYPENGPEADPDAAGYDPDTSTIYVPRWDASLSLAHEVLHYAFDLCRQGKIDPAGVGRGSPDGDGLVDEERLIDGLLWLLQSRKAIPA